MYTHEIYAIHEYARNNYGSFMQKYESKTKNGKAISNYISSFHIDFEILISGLYSPFNKGWNERSPDLEKSNIPNSYTVGEFYNLFQFQLPLFRNCFQEVGLINPSSKI